MNIRKLTKKQIDTLSELELKENEDEHIEHIVEQHYNKYGQLKIPIICVVDGKVRVVDGMKYMKTISQFTDVVITNYVGKISLKQFLILRIYMNFTNQRTHFINLAKTITSIINNKADIDKIANKTNLTPVEVERYNELLDFDWGAFKKIDTNIEQNKLF